MASLLVQTQRVPLMRAFSYGCLCSNLFECLVGLHSYTVIEGVYMPLGASGPPSTSRRWAHGQNR